jgi:hypothetical protein
MSDIDGFERIRMMLARSGKDQSYAQRKHSYRDPAKTIKFDREKTMQRDIDEVETLLDMWADDMRRPSQEVQGYPSEAAGGWIASWRKDSEEAQDAADRQTIEKVNAAYDSLSAIYRDAINRHYKLGANVWRFARNVDFDEAKIVVRVKFVQRGLL